MHAIARAYLAFCLAVTSKNARAPASAGFAVGRRYNVPSMTKKKSPPPPPKLSQLEALQARIREGTQLREERAAANAAYEVGERPAELTVNELKALRLEATELVRKIDQALARTPVPDLSAEQLMMLEDARDEKVGLAPRQPALEWLERHERAQRQLDGLGDSGDRYGIREGARQTAALVLARKAEQSAAQIEAAEAAEKPRPRRRRRK